MGIILNETIGWADIIVVAKLAANANPHILARILLSRLTGISFQQPKLEGIWATSIAG